MNKKLIPLIAIAFVLAVFSTAVFYWLFASRLNAEPGAPSTPEQDAASAVPQGMRAVSVHVSDSSGIVALLKPGLKVDIQMFASQPPKSLKEEMRTLLRGVSVMAVNTQPEQSSQGYFNGPVVTLIASAADAEQLAWADSYSRLRLSLRNPREPAGIVGPALNLEVTAIRLTAEGLAQLSTRVGSRLDSQEIQVIAANDPLTEFFKPGGQYRVESESIVSAAVGRDSLLEVPGEGKSVRLSVAALDGAGRITLRPEIRGTWRGRPETRSLETEVEAKLSRPILISGLNDEVKPAGRFRHLVLVITRQQP